MERCPNCYNVNFDPFIHRDNFPVFQNALYDTPREAIECIRGEVTMCVCRNCGMIFNSTFDQNLMMYNNNYDNSQNFSDRFKKHLDEIYIDFFSKNKINNKKILEIGCGKGEFLNQLINNSGNKNIGYGYDPSYIGPLEKCQGRLRYFKRFFGDNDKFNADVIISRHVIEHISEFRPLLKNIYRNLSNRKDSFCYLETPCVDWILKNGVFWDFFYEHCSLFTIRSIVYALKNENLIPKNINKVFNGQYIGISCSKSNSNYKKNNIDPSYTIKLVEQYKSKEEMLLGKWSGMIKDLHKKGSISIWGGGAKGVTFANLVDPGFDFIDAIIDINPNKQGKYTPGTGHPIVSPSTAFKRNIRYSILMNPNYQKEVKTILNNLDFDLTIIY